MPRGVSRYDAARLQGRLWTPAHGGLGMNLLTWADLVDRSTLTLDGNGGIAQARDLGGKGNHLTPVGTAVAPVLDQSRLGLAPHFGPANGSNVPRLQLTLASNLQMVADQAIHIYAVGTFEATSSFPRLFSITTIAGTTDYNNGNNGVAVYYNASALYCNSGAAAWSGTVPLAPSLTPRLFEFALRFTGGNSIDRAPFIDGIGPAWGTNLQTGGVGSPFVGLIAIGSDASYYATGAEPWFGHFAEIVVDAGIFSEQRRGRIASYLAYKHSLGPQAHPYFNRSGPPLIGA